MKGEHMKTLLIASVVVISFITASAFAAPPATQATKDAKAKKNFTKDMDAQEVVAKGCAAELSTAIEDKGKLDAFGESILGEKQKLIEDDKALKAKMSEFRRRHTDMEIEKDYANGVIADWNGRCKGTIYDPAFFNACAEEKLQLQKKFRPLEHKIVAMKKEEKELLVYEINERDRITRETEANALRDKANKDNIEKNLAKQQQLKMSMAKIQAQVDSCKTAIANCCRNKNSREKMHAVCGQMWDGNTPKPELNK